MTFVIWRARNVVAEERDSLTAFHLQDFPREGDQGPSPRWAKICTTCFQLVVNEQRHSCRISSLPPSNASGKVLNTLVEAFNQSSAVLAIKQLIDTTALTNLPLTMTINTVNSDIIYTGYAANATEDGTSAMISFTVRGKMTDPPQDSPGSPTLSLGSVSLTIELR